MTLLRQPIAAIPSPRRRDHIFAHVADEIVNAHAARREGLRTPLEISGRSKRHPLWPHRCGRGRAHARGLSRASSTARRTRARRLRRHLPRAGGSPIPRDSPLLSAIQLIDSACRTGFLTFFPFLLIAKGASVASIGFGLSLVFVGGAAGKLVCGLNRRARRHSAHRHPDRAGDRRADRGHGCWCRSAGRWCC